MTGVKEPVETITVRFVALGCAKNLVDSEKMLGLLAEAGLLPVGPEDPADLAIINTCGFIAAARAEAAEHIEAALADKRAGRLGRVIVAGCLAQYHPDHLRKHYPELDGVVGLDQRDHIAHLARRLVRESVPAVPTPAPAAWRAGDSTFSVSGTTHPDRMKTHDDSPQVVVPSDQARLRLTEPCWSYLRISEGCSRGCTFCTIPAIRGPFRSKAPDAILAEAEELIADGAVELNLIAQETSAYGQDQPEYGSLARLLRELNRLSGLHWLRVLYTHPASITDELIAALAECDKVTPYLDVPLQHINDRILRLMHRRIDRAGTERLLNRLRRTINNLALRTTMLVGFPSETEDEFAELLDFVREFRFEALGAFAYSAEPGTAAARMPGQLPEPVKRERLDRLMTLQQEIAFNHADRYRGRELTCLLIRPAQPDKIAHLDLDFTPDPSSDAPPGPTGASQSHSPSGSMPNCPPAPTGTRFFVARHAGQAPEIDSECYLQADPPSPGDKAALVPGAMVRARITARCGYDLVGRVVRLEETPPRP